MAAIADIWKPCTMVFGGTKYTGYLNPDTSAMPIASPSQMAKAAEQYGEAVKSAQFAEVYLDGWGFHTIPAEWIIMGGQPMEKAITAPAPEPVSSPKRKAAPPPPPAKKKAPPPPPPRKRAS